MTPDPPIRVSIARHFRAPPARVFDAWMDPEKVARWMAGTGDASAAATLIHAVIDPRVGGRFSFVDRRDGEDVDHTGEYLEIEPPRRLAFTWSIPKYSPDSDRIALDVTPTEDGCDVFLVCEVDPAWADYAERTRRAWSLMLDAIARTVE
jgi:uncharacterized protein YndB with AHSA1/START domain